jgi:uncharacterized membrane protein
MKYLPEALRTYWLALLFVAANLALLAIVYNRLPDPLPVLWNSDGEVIARFARPAGAMLLPLAQILLTWFLVAAPVIDPGALRTPEVPRFYPTVVAVISLFLLFATTMLFAAALGAQVSLPHALLEGLGVLTILVGNHLGKLPKNYVVGIRTPWTLSSEYVWERTHRFAAPLFVTTGFGLLLHGLLQPEHLSGAFVGTIIVVTLLAPYFHSYVTWKRTLGQPAT